LLWARDEQGKIPFEPAELRFADICESVLKTLTPNAILKNIRIDYSSVSDMKIFADSNMLKTIMRNLVSNAIKFTNNDGIINISAENKSDRIKISVSDNGVGIPSENLSKLFNISEVLQTDGTANEKGTGLGLLLCKEFVEKHGGEIVVESKIGEGSIFSFTIPKLTLSRK
jgi:signal transduction histidine kinase